MLMLGTMLEMKAADVYLLTAQTINGSVGKYEVPSNHQLAQNTLSAGESGGTVVQSATDVAPGYYLVGNFFSEHNIGKGVNPGGDGATIDYTKHVYFKFEQQKDKSYAFSIPACLTAHAQILAVADDGSMMVYGPGSEFGLHGAKNGTARPVTNGAVGTMGTPTADCIPLKGSATLAEDGNYWNLETRNDGVTDDDGLYTFSFTLDKDGNPSDWQVKHDATRCVSYILGNMDGATAQPLYDERKNDGKFDNNIEASLYFDGSHGYWGIGFIVHNVNRDNAKDLYEQAIKATPDIHPTKSVNDNSGTHNKLFFLGNGGLDYFNSTDNNRNKVWPNQKPFTLNLHGIKRVQLNLARGDDRLAEQDGSYGMSGEILIFGTNQADFTITDMSMIGDAVEGTYDAPSNWKYDSKAGDMKYDANERCFSLTISTVDEKYATPHYFRFVANHDAKQNWGETDDNISSKKGFARAHYDADDDDNHSCMADDPNDVQFRRTARENVTPNKKDILWNRPAGIWTIRFYPELDKNGNDISRYTISGTKVIKIPFTYCLGKFIRTYSNNVAMAPVDDNVKVYEAYRYKKTENAGDPLSERMGTVYLRQLKYIPANMGVVLVGEVPKGDSFSDYATLNFSLKEAPAEMPLEGDNYTAVWTKADEYVNDGWNNYLKPTVTAIDKLGNADTDKNGKIAHRYFGLANFHSTKYYKENNTGDDYIGFFRLTPNGKSGANKAYLSIPANATIDGGVGAKFGYIDFNGQFLGNETDDPKNPSLSKMAIVFDDEDDGGSTTTVTEVKPNSTDADASFYTLQGVKVSRPVKGVYIHNGKKFIK